MGVLVMPSYRGVWSWILLVLLGAAVGFILVWCVEVLVNHVRVSVRQDIVKAAVVNPTFYVTSDDLIEFPDCGVVLRYRDAILWIPDVRYDREKKTLVPLRRRGVGSEGPDQPK